MMETTTPTAGSHSGPCTVVAWAARVALTAGLTTLACLAGLHVLSPEFDPSWRVVSEYALGSHARVLSLMFLAWAVSSWGLALALWPQVKTLAGRVGLFFLAVAGVGEAMASVFDLSRLTLHNLAGALGVLSLPVAALLISVSLSRTQAWYSARLVIGGVACLTWLSLAAMAFAMATLRGKAGWPRLPIGWPNRLLVVVYCAWVIVVAWRVLRLRGRPVTAASAAPVACRT